MYEAKVFYVLEFQVHIQIRNCTFRKKNLNQNYNNSFQNENEVNEDENDLDENDEKRMNDHQNEEVNEPICYQKTISETAKAEIISEPALAAPALALAKPSVDETIKDTTEDLDEDQAPLASMESDPAPLASLDSITNSDLQSM